MNKLTHPATIFLQALPYTEIAFKDMTEAQRESLMRFMWFNGDGIWGEVCRTRSASEMLKRFGDVRFGMGKFANNDTMKTAFVLATDTGAADHEAPLKWFEENCVCDDITSEAYPVILNHPDIAPEFGLFEWGYEYFYGYWVKQPETEFIRFLPGWDASDETGRGGQ